jgi:hypothetical protein
MDAKSYNPVDDLVARIRPFWKNEKMPVCFPVHLLLGRVEK